MDTSIRATHALKQAVFATRITSHGDLRLIGEDRILLAHDMSTADGKAAALERVVRPHIFLGSHVGGG